MKKYSYSSWKEDGPKEKFEYFLTEESEKLMDWITALEQKEIMCYFNIVFPDNWDEYTFQEKTIFFKSTPVDIVIDSVFFRTGGDNDVFLKLQKHKHINRIHIFGGNIKADSFAILKSFKELDGLLIYGDYGDEIIPYLTVCRGLRQLDVQTTNITSKGKAKLRENLTIAELWLPNN